MGNKPNNKAGFNYNKIEKKEKNFMYMNLYRSHCYNSNFSKSNFDFVNMRGAHFKACNFDGCSFQWTEFMGTNLKKSLMRGTKLTNTIFEEVNLDGVDFKDAKFKNVIFLNCKLEGVKNLKRNSSEIRILDSMPEVEISEELEAAVTSAMENEFVKKSRVLDNKDKEIDKLSVMILKENFDEETLIKGLNYIKEEINRDFHTLSYIIKAINNM